MRVSLVLLTLLFLAGPSNAQSYAHNYESFFGKEDRIGLYSQEAIERFTSTVLKTIQDNTLLIDCGTNGKPSTAFVAKTKEGSRIISAAHNLTMAQRKNQHCKVGKILLEDGETAKNFKDSGTIEDVAYDVAQWPNLTPHTGFDICENLKTSTKYVLVQSIDGNGTLGLSPFCKVRSIKNNLITTNCRGHYKSSGAPLLAIRNDEVCVAGIFNAHSGRRFEFESYAARLSP
ncbi:hypothetical protein [Hellea balneolensis]|uniref:hypothetical protein n=1 Tax=Hellea balneolensis TaxID=287478 RepID=UPI000479680B|nr:hypothetical protein [Hellea balneolensis]